MKVEPVVVAVLGIRSWQMGLNEGVCIVNHLAAVTKYLANHF